jgi:hypothetical protein
MKRTIKVIFGKEQVNKFISNIPFSEDEKEMNVKEYYFESELEILAFKKGIIESIGWVECYFVDVTLCDGK